MGDAARRRHLAAWVVTVSLFGATYGAVAAPVAKAAAPASTTATANSPSSPAYLTVLIGRALASKAIGCQTPAGMLTLDQVVQQLSAIGIAVTVPVIPGRTQATATSCIANNLYPSWADLTNLATNYGLTAVSASQNYAHMTSLSSTAEQFKQSCGSLSAFIANGFHRAWGLFAYPDNMYSTAIQTNVVQDCFAYGRTYVNPHSVNGTEATNSETGTTSPWLQVTDDIGGGRCNVPGQPCYTEGVSSIGHYLSPSTLQALTTVAPGSWTSLQAYTFVQGSSTSGPLQWDCTDPNWKLHWTNLYEVYCWNDFLSALSSIPSSVTVTDPATVAEAWGRIPTPVVTITSLSPASLSGATKSTKLTWFAEENGTYSVLVGGVDCTSGTQVASGSYTRAPSSLVLTILRSALPSGTNPMRVCLTNDAAHVGSETTTVTSAAGPTVTSVSPSATNLTFRPTITVTGTNFTIGATVKVGSATAAAATVHVVSSTVITAQAPFKPGGLAGTYNVVVTDSLGTSPITPADDFSYEGAPSVTGVSPPAGPTAGGTSITITGSNFYPDATVTVGGVAATGVVVNASSSISATTPLSSAGYAVDDVVVAEAGGTSSTSAVDRFTYEAGPSVTGVVDTTTGTNPAQGSAGDSITITGSNFYADATVFIGGATASIVSFSGGTTLVATVPADPNPSPGPSGDVDDVLVAESGGTSPTTAADLFTYEAAPSITGVTDTMTGTSNPAFGAAGDTITITGSNLYADATVTIGGAPATVITISTDGTSMTATVPSDPSAFPVPGDTYDVLVREAGGTATDDLAFTYI